MAININLVREKLKIFTFIPKPIICCDTVSEGGG